jgi:hypothetical protein
LMITFLGIRDSNASGVVNTLAGWNPIGNSEYAPSGSGRSIFPTCGSRVLSMRAQPGGPSPEMNFKDWA